jgi:hypothetical protein
VGRQRLGQIAAVPVADFREGREPPDRDRLPVPVRQREFIGLVPHIEELDVVQVVGLEGLVPHFKAYASVGSYARAQSIHVARLQQRRDRVGEALGLQS